MQSYGTPSIAIRAVKKVNPMKIGWVSPWDLNAAQTRIRVINIHRRLISIGYDSKVISFEDAINNNFDVVIVGKDFSEYAYSSILTIKKESYVVCDVCEDLIDLNIPYYQEIIAASHKVISASDYLTERLKKINPNTETIYDAIETDLRLNCSYKNTKLKVVYLGYFGNSYLAENHRPLIEECGMELVKITEKDYDVKWERETWVSEILKCDIALIPQRSDQPSKSNNKCTQMMALGLPVIVSHHPAYTSLIRDNENGFYFKTVDDLWRILNFLKNDNNRFNIGQQGKRKCNIYTIPSITDQWIDKFLQIQKKVDIIITTYNNLEYLKVTLESIKQCTTYPYEILVIDSGNDDTHQYCLDNDIQIIRSVSRLTFAEANNLGIKTTRNHYICLLNNDVVVTHGWLDELVKGTEKYSIVGPLSNCDKGWLHDLDYTIDGVDLIPGMKINDFKDITQLYTIKGMNEYVVREWIAFYCVLMERSVIDKVGILDQGFKNNAEDVDFGKRIWLNGLTVGQNYNSYVFHFGGKTRKVSESENYMIHHQEDSESSSYLTQKYEKETVVIWQGPSFVPWDQRNLKLGNIGGSEVWTINLSMELDKLGYRVIVFNDCSNMRKFFGNIEYIHWTEFGIWNNMNYMDYFISSRSVEPFKLNLHTKNKYCFIHDIFIMLNSPSDIQYHNRVNKFFCLSTAHRDFVCKHHKIDNNRILIGSNGIDFNRFQNIDEGKRDRYKIIYSSSPDRGLENLLNIWPEIKKRIPEIHLHVYYGFDWIKDKAWSENMMNRMKKLDVVYHGKVNQYELAEAFMTSRVFAAPNFFEETFFIGGLEAMASGCVFLGSGFWGILDTIKEGGVLIPIENRMDCTLPSYHEKFINELDKLINDDEYFQQWQSKGFERVKRFSWENVAKQWDHFFKTGEWNVIQ